MWGTLEDDGPTVREEAPRPRERPQRGPAQNVKTRRRTRSQPPVQSLVQGKTLHGYPFKAFADPPALTMKIAPPHVSSTLAVVSGVLGLLVVSALIAAIIAFAS